MMDKKGLTPGVATIILIIFALLLGSLVMAFGEDYVDAVPNSGPKKSTVCVKVSKDPLKVLQVEYLNGKISKTQYLAREKQLIR
tara:strand:- start:3422 stop:3673 length:252 start_codon:yes stop_codon:yes gene_type:complete